MEDQVPFKVFTHWGGNSKPEVRRFGVDKNMVTSFVSSSSSSSYQPVRVHCWTKASPKDLQSDRFSFVYLNAKLQDIFPSLRSKSYCVTWKDEEGDDVTVSSDDEIMTALTAMSGDLIRLHVHCKEAPADEDDGNIIFATVAGSGDGRDAIHYGVQCDGCNSQVVGWRYKCTSCEDFDLCSRCEADGKHPEHCMLRVPAPVMSRALVKAAIKRSRNFLKSVAGAVGDECNYKKHRRDKSGERKCREDRHSGHHERHHRRQRGSWLETFATYMNEFANLAGDVNIDIDKPANSPRQASSGQNQEQQKTATENTQAPNSEGNTSAPKPPGSTQCPFSPNITAETIPELIRLFLGGNLENLIPTPSTSASNDAAVNTNDVVTNNASVNTNDVVTNNASVNTSDDVEMAQAQPTHDPETGVNSETASNASSKRDESPDKADDWTMINKEKDLMDAYIKQGSAAETPIGFNLPTEFQDRVRISEGQTLYPPLNTATAVLNPKEPEKLQPSAPVQPPQPSPAQPQAYPAQPQANPGQPKANPAQANSTQAQVKPTPPPQQRPRQRYHAKAHIDAAIEQMLVMGFTNDGGWLTQLVESKDGNIAAVLDLLTPVTPKK